MVQKLSNLTNEEARRCLARWEDWATRTNTPLNRLCNAAGVDIVIRPNIKAGKSVMRYTAQLMDRAMEANPNGIPAPKINRTVQYVSSPDNALTAEQIEQRRNETLEARMRHLEACDRASRARYGRPVGRPVDWMAA